MSDALLSPCPFCGASGIHPAGCWHSDEDGESVSALCINCGAQGPIVKEVGRRQAPDYEPTAETVTASIAAWNRRVR